MALVSAKPSWDAELYEARHAFVWRLGEQLIDLLDPKAGENILDLGCGTGQLTQKIAERGARVTGLDASPEMIGQARQNFPQLRFVLADAATMRFRDEFDAIFSNAALHWMIDASTVAKNMARALRAGGRVVVELGGKGNIGQIQSAIESVVGKFVPDVKLLRRTYFPSIGEYTSLLEAAGLSVRNACLFERPTKLEGTEGMANWICQFKWYYFEALAPQDHIPALRETVEMLRPALYRDGEWIADYWRLRVLAVKD